MQERANVEFTLTERRAKEGRLPVIGNAVEFSISYRVADKAAPL